MAAHQAGVEMRQLLRSEPTDIFTYKDAIDLAKEKKAIAAEMWRRGWLVDVTPTEEPASENAETADERSSRTDVVAPLSRHIVP